MKRISVTFSPQSNVAYERPVWLVVEYILDERSRIYTPKITTFRHLRIMHAIELKDLQFSHLNHGEFMANQIILFVETVPNRLSIVQYYVRVMIEPTISNNLA